MSTTTNVNQVKLNIMTQQQYDSAEKSATELYMVTDASDTIQTASMPTASSTYENQIYQYVGTTDQDYTNGYFYKCIGAGEPVVYSWTRVDVQPAGSSLPSQSGNSGKFLTTDGTDASWGNAIANNATGTNSVSIYGTNSNDREVVIGYNAAGSTATSMTGGVYIGYNAGNYSRTQNGEGIAIGQNTRVYRGAIAVGYNTTSTAQYGIAIGYGTSVANGAQYAIQLGDSGSPTVNSDANTFKVGNGLGNFELMSADGTVPTARLTKVNTTITLESANWSSNTQTVNVTGMTATGVVLVSPIPADQSDYTSAGILCAAQAAGTLTFSCDSVPSNDIDVTVIMI